MHEEDLVDVSGAAPATSHDAPHRSYLAVLAAERASPASQGSSTPLSHAGSHATNITAPF